ncbi:hypothetical protein HDU96_010367 [Phlyctochytrium bullatum]|nr:hypothetical protein HDU96_010367 [Phlyctochytrium bullatum]
MSASAGKRLWGAYLDPAAFSTIQFSYVLEFHALFVFVFLMNGWKDSLNMTIKGIIPTTFVHAATYFMFAFWQMRGLRIAMGFMAIATFTAYELIKGFHYFEIAEKHVTPKNAIKSRQARLRIWYWKWFKLGVSVAGLQVLAISFVQFSSNVTFRFFIDLLVQAIQISVGAVLRSTYNNILVTMGVVSKETLGFMQKGILLRMTRAEIAEKQGTPPTWSPPKLFASLQRLFGNRSTAAERQIPSLFPTVQQHKEEPIVASVEEGLPQYSQPPRQIPPRDIIVDTPAVPTAEQLNDDYVEYRNNHAVMSFASTTITISSIFLVGWGRFMATYGKTGPWVDQLFQVAALWYVSGFFIEVLLVRIDHWRGLPIGPLPTINEATTWYFGSYFPVLYLIVYSGAHGLYELVPEQQ